ncbi:MAG: hypothetical protein ACP5E4_01470, partial [Candidatus Aenigmatarchaeota archaeon]
TYTNSTALTVIYSVTEANINFTNVSVLSGAGTINSTTNTSTGTVYSYLRVYADGTYNITATAYDLAGNTNQSLVPNWVLDTTPPNSTAINPTQNTYTNQILIDITFRLTETNINTTNCTITNSTGQALNSTSNTSTGTVHCYLSVYNDGAYNITLHHSDLAGNTNTTEIQNVTLDRTNPQISITNPPADSTLTSRTIDITLTVTEDNLNHTNCTIRNSTGSLLNSTANASTGNVHCYLQIYEDTKINITATAYDLAGNQNSTTSSNITIDTGVPALTFLTLNDTSPVAAGNVTFTLDFSEAMNQTVNPTVKIQNSSIYTITAIGWSNSTRWTGYYNFTTGTGDGNYTINVTAAKDLAGNTMDGDASNTFLLDTIHPAFGNHQRSPDTPNEDQSVQINVTITEINPGTVTLEWNGTANYTITTNQSNTFYFTINTTNYTAHDLITYYWYANDTAGNLNISAQQNFTVANRIPTTTQPLIDNATPKTNDLLNCTGGTFSDEDDEDTEQNRGFMWYDGESEVLGQTNQTLDLSENGLDKGDSIKCSVRVYDGYNWSEWANSSNTAIIQNTPPMISTSPGTATINASMAEWNYDFNATDPDADDGTDNLTWADNSGLFDINHSTGEITYLPQEEDAGTYGINISVSDGEANDTYGFNCTVTDDVPPSVQLNSPNQEYYD